jgi:hypothetical protein
MAACANCVGMGIEIEFDRYIVSNNLSLALLNSRSLYDIDIKISFVNESIENIISLNGVSKIFMFDKVFIPELLTNIGLLFNKSTTVKHILSTKKNLDQFGFNATFVGQVDNLASRGHQMHHNFNLYSSNAFVESNDLDFHHSINMDHRISEHITIASCKNVRLQNVEEIMRSFQQSKPGLRKNQFERILGENDKTTAT